MLRRPIVYAILGITSIAALALFMPTRTIEACSCSGGFSMSAPADGEVDVPTNTRIWLAEEFGPPDDVELVGPAGPVALARSELNDVAVFTPTVELTPATKYTLSQYGYASSSFTTGAGPMLTPPPIPTELDRDITNEGATNDSCGGHVHYAYISVDGSGVLVLLDRAETSELDVAAVSGTVTDAAPTRLGGASLFVGDGHCASNWPEAKRGSSTTIRLAAYDLAGNFSGWSEPDKLRLGGCNIGADAGSPLAFVLLMLASRGRRRRARPTTTAALSTCCLLACSSTPTPEPTRRAEPPAQPQPPTQPAPPAQPQPIAPTAATPTPTPAPPPPAIREAGVPAPSSKTILALARAAKLAAPASATTPEPFGPRHYVAIVRTRSGAAPPRFGLHALLLTLPPADGATWTIASSIELLRWSREWHDDADAGTIPTTIAVDDHDDDGELELLVRFRNQIMCGGGGENEVTTLMFVEFAETPPHIALKTEIDHALSNGAVHTKTKVMHEDLDGDGHRDLKIEYRTQDEGEPPIVAERRWRWDPTTDAWARLAADGKWQDYARKDGCDW